MTIARYELGKLYERYASNGVALDYLEGQQRQLINHVNFENNALNRKSAFLPSCRFWLSRYSRPYAAVWAAHLTMLSFSHGCPCIASLSTRHQRNPSSVYRCSYRRARSADINKKAANAGNICGATTGRNYSMATTKKSATVEIKPMELQTVSFSIVGTSPLIIHAWDDKAKQMMLDKQRGKATKTKHEIKIPVNDFMGALYWLTEKPQQGESDEEAESIWLGVKDGAKFGFPVTGIKQSAIMGAKRGGLDVVATELRGSFFIEGATEASTIDIAEIIGAEPWMREDMVKVGGMSKTADIRFRPQFDEWEIPLKMTYNVNGKYSLEQLMNCFNVGGFVCGIGEWRPERDGQMGMYRVKI